MALTTPGDSSMSEEHKIFLDIIQRNHDEAFLYVSQGLSYQEQNKYDLAREMYLKGLDKIDKALLIRTDLEYCVGPKWNHAQQLQVKMRKTYQMIKSQLKSTLDKPALVSPSYTPPELPPSYNEACGYDPLFAQRRCSLPSNSTESNKNPEVEQKFSSEVLDLFCIPGDVNIFYVSHDGSVSAPNSPTSLNIYQFVEHNVDPSVRPQAWLQIGSWTYPLLPNQSPVFESSYGAFIFPNIGLGRDSAVGVIFPPSVTLDRRAEFLLLLNQLSAFKDEKKPELPEKLEAAPSSISEAPSSISETISKGLVTGAEYLSAGLVTGANLSSDLIHKGAVKVRQKISPNQPISVNPRVKGGLKIAHDTTKVAFEATTFLVKKIGDLTKNMGSYMEPYIREKGTKILTNTFNKDPKDAKDTVDGVLTVAAGGVQGVSTVYTGLEQAAKVLAFRISTETVDAINLKYGDDVGEVVGNALFSIGNLALTTHNIQSLGIKSIAKRTAKDAGKAVLKNYAGKQPLPPK